MRGESLVVPLAPVVIGDEAAHGSGEVCVDDDGVGFEGAGCGLDAGGLAAFDEHALDGLVEEDLHAQLFRDASHGAGDCAAAADRVEDAVLVFQEGEDGEEAGAAEGRHAEVLGLKGEAEADALIFEVHLEIAVEGFPGSEQRKELEHVRLGEVAPAFEGGLEEGEKAGRVSRDCV